MEKQILFTGGAGDNLSHCVLALLNKGFNSIVFDNLSTGDIETIETLKKFANVSFYNDDLLNSKDLKQLFRQKSLDDVVNFAAFSQVGESVKKTQKYYINTVFGTINLLEAMLIKNIKNLYLSFNIL